MNLKCYLLCIILCSTFYSCTDDIDADYKSQLLETIDVTKVSDNVKLSDILSLVDCVKLGNNKSTYIYGISEIEITSNEIFILDHSRQDFESIIVFDKKTGDFKRNIGRQGEGPGEFYGIGDITISKDGQRLSGLIPGTMSIMNYNVNGDFISKYNTNIFGDQFAEVEENIFAVYNESSRTDISEEHYILFVGEEGQILKKYLPFEYGFSTGFAFTGFLSKSKNIWTSPPFSDIVYKVEKDKVEPQVKIDFGVHEIPKEFRKNPEKVSGNRLLENSYLSEKFLEFNDSYVFNFKNIRNKSIGIYNRKKKEFFEPRKLKHDYLKDILSFGKISYDNNKLVFVLTPERFAYLKNNKKNFIKNIEENNSLLFEITKDFDSKSNPILLFFEFKS